ncbi:MAG: hypothetical protein ACOVOW_06795 [Spirosomataceae bacterium]
MEIVLDLIKIVMPAGLVLFAMYLMVSTLVKKELIHQELTNKKATNETILPLRLQAYERMCLFLERISPSNILIRLNGRAATVNEFQALLLSEIREEFSHNLAQQVYLSDNAWMLVKKAMNDTVTVINLAANEVKSDAPAIELSKQIFEIQLKQQLYTSEEALLVVKEEVRSLFF